MDTKQPGSPKDRDRDLQRKDVEAPRSGSDPKPNEPRQPGMGEDENKDYEPIKDREKLSK